MHKNSTTPGTYLRGHGEGLCGKLAKACCIVGEARAKAAQGKRRANQD